MKLIDILVEELPKRGGWPTDASRIVQDSDGEAKSVAYGKDLKSPNNVGVWHRSGGRSAQIGVLPLADDWQTAIITREQYKAALAAKNDGWIEWGGGECPVSASEMVDVIFGHGGRMSTNIADCWRWNHSGTSSDIIAYRPHKPLEQQLPSEEVPVWNGEGLPPVGCECEYSLNGGKTWWDCKIDYIVGTQGVVMLCDTFEGVQYAPFSSYGNALKFRPTRSEADRKRDAAVEAIDRYMPEFIPDTPNDYYNAKKIYDAIAAGKIPGVKLED